MLETDWESVYRGWKEGLGWTNRARGFARCEVWLGDLQEKVWEDREWGRTANYIVPPPARTTGEQGEQQAQMEGGAVDGADAGVGGDGDEGGGLGQGGMNVVLAGLDESDDEEMMAIEHEGNVMLTGDLDQFQWP